MGTKLNFFRKGNPDKREHANSTQPCLGIELKGFLLGGDSATQLATVKRENEIQEINSYLVNLITHLHSGL